MEWFNFSKTHPLITPQNKRLVRYLIVGVLGLGINQAVFLVLYNHTAMPYFVAGFLGSAVSTFANYVINDSWTWRDNGTDGILQWIWRGLKYAATRIVGLGIGTISQILFVEILLINPAIANILKVGVGALWGFGASEKWVWKSTDSPSDESPAEN